MGKSATHGRKKSAWAVLVAIRELRPRATGWLKTAPRISNHCSMSLCRLLVANLTRYTLTVTVNWQGPLDRDLLKSAIQRM